MAINVGFTRAELTYLLPQYRLIADCLSGGRAIREAGTIYLPQPNALDLTPANVQRYADYVNRAIFYNVTKHTHEGLIGTVFARDPVLDLPDIMSFMAEDANGAGVGLVQLAKETLGKVTAFGRAGILSDFPATEEDTPRSRLLTGEVRPTITLYDPRNIINWRERIVNGVKQLSLVVLAESVIVEDDGFEFQTEKQFRVLRLEENNTYTVTIYQGDDFKLVSQHTPRNSSGSPLAEIPFKFIGAENNSAEPDAPPLYDLAELNIGHYRNSADFEETCFIVGQPTPYFTGLTEQWVTEVLKGEILLGARAAIPLPTGSSAGLLQAAANLMPMQAMEHKERQMVALGARLIQQKEVQRTATEAKGDRAATESTLSSTAKNVSSAFLWALNKSADFVGAAGSNSLDFVLNSEFELSSMTPEEQKQVVENWQKNAITTSEMRDRFSKAGIATLDFDTYTKEREEDMALIAENVAMMAGNNEPVAEE